MAGPDWGEHSDGRRSAMMSWAGDKLNLASAVACSSDDCMTERVHSLDPIEYRSSVKSCTSCRRPKPAGRTHSSCMSAECSESQVAN